jgi:hypothetical protein
MPGEYMWIEKSRFADEAVRVKGDDQDRHKGGWPLGHPQGAARHLPSTPVPTVHRREETRNENARGKMVPSFSLAFLSVLHQL